MEHNCNYNQVSGDTTNAPAITYTFGASYSAFGNKHNHAEICKHKSIKFCQKCDVPYCPDCGREWRENTYYYHPYWYYQPYWYNPNYVYDTNGSITYRT